MSENTTNGDANGEPSGTDIMNAAKWYAYYLSNAVNEASTPEEAEAIVQDCMTEAPLHRPPNCVPSKGLGNPEMPPNPEAFPAPRPGAATPKQLRQMQAMLSQIDAGLSDLTDDALLLLPPSPLAGIQLGTETLIESAVEEMRRRLLQSGLGPWSVPPIIDAQGQGSGTLANAEAVSSAHGKTGKTGSARSRAKARLNRARRRLPKSLRLKLAPAWVKSVLGDFEFLERRPS
jgi:hypothetical protein